MSGVVDSLWINSTEVGIKNLNQSVDSLLCKQNALQAKTDLLYSVIETSNSSVSNQLTSASYFLALLAVVVAIVSIFLGIHISKKKKEIELIAQTIEEKKEEVVSMTIATTKLNEQIHGDLKNLYTDLRKEETNAFLERLILEPKDIANLLQILLARDLEDEGFNKLREAYLNLSREIFSSTEVDRSIVDANWIFFSRKYLLLFFQNYCYQTLLDSEIRPRLVEDFGLKCQQAFKRDIIKSTIDLCKAISEENSTFNKEEVLVEYLKALNESPHKNLEDLKNIMKQNINPQSLLTNAIKRCTKEGVVLELFGKE